MVWDVNAKDEYGEKALHTAAMRGDAEKAWMLIATGADVNAKSSAGMTALHWAAVRGHAKTVRALVELGADVNAANELQTRNAVALRR